MIRGGWRQDIQQAFRLPFKSPGFTLLVVATLSLAIGVNSAIFSLVDALLFHPLRVERAADLWRVFPVHPHITGWSYPAYRDLRDGARSFAALAAYGDASPVHMTHAGGPPARVSAMLVSGNYFATLGARPLAGRLLGDADDTAVADAAVVLSRRLFAESFGGDPRAVGQVVQIGGRPFTIAGVAPAGFTGASLESFPDLFIPLAAAESVLPDFAEWKPLTRRGFSWLNVVGSMRPGVGPSAARAEINALVTGMAARGEGPELEGVRLATASEAALGFETLQAGRTRLAARLLFGVVLVVLAIACANAAGLLLVRGERRGREIAIRRALGASGGRIVRQLLVESGFLALLAAGGGLILATWTLEAARLVMPRETILPSDLAGGVGDPRVLVYTLAVAILTSLVFGLLPAIRAARVDLISGIKGDAAMRPAGSARPALREALVGVELALAVVLLAGAGLLLRTLRMTAAVEPGFAVDHRLTASFDLGLAGYDEARATAFYDQLLEASRALPGVRSAALARIVPITTRSMANSVEYEGYAGDPEQAPIVAFNVVTPGFFRTMGMPLLRGRDFATTDRRDSALVVVVNEAFAKRFWPGQEPVGRLIRNLGPQGGRVVGVVRDARLASLRAAPEPYLFLPLSQFHLPGMSVVLETTGEPGTAAPALAAAVSRIDPRLPLYSVETLADRLGVARGQERLLAWLLGVFAGLALALAGAGLYAVTAYATEARTREFGIRMALGATRAQVMSLVLRRSAVVALGGAVVGMLAAAALSGLFRSLLFGVGRTDPVAFGASLTLLAAVALAACALPARRATRVDPMVALRAE